MSNKTAAVKSFTRPRGFVSITRTLSGRLIYTRSRTFVQACKHKRAINPAAVDSDRSQRDKWAIYRLPSSAELFHISLNQEAKLVHIQLTAMTHRTSPWLSAGSPCAARSKQWRQRLGVWRSWTYNSACKRAPLAISSVYIFAPNTPGTALSLKATSPKMTWFHSFIGSLSSVRETVHFFSSSGFRDSEQST